jgi:hypothetical protein
LENTRSTLAEAHLTTALHDVLATNRLNATDEMAVFGTHPYKRSSVLAWGFPDSVVKRSPDPGRCSFARQGALSRREGGCRVRL